MNIKQDNNPTLDVLILDTNPTFVKTMANVLTRVGYNAKGTTDKNEAVELIKQNPAWVVYDTSCMLRVISQNQVREYCPNTYILGIGISPVDHILWPTHADCLSIGFDGYVGKKELVDWLLKEIVLCNRTKFKSR